MKKVIFILISLILFISCSSSHHETVELTVSYALDQGRTCQTYLADHFLVSVYDSELRQITEKKIPCEDMIDEITLSVEKDSYYVSVVLRDSKDDWQSYGATKIDVVDDAEVVINMKPYIGGMIFKWNSEKCTENNISVMSFDLVAGEEPVHAVVWGEDVEMTSHQVPCVAGRLDVINIDPEPTYSAKVNAYRKYDSKQSRILYEVSDFVSGHGKNKEIDIEDSKKAKKTILVSDMKVSWVFDSRSIDSCEAAGVTQAVGILDSDRYTITATRECENKFPNILNIYDITEHEYTLTLYGKDSNGRILFESSLDVGLIKPGSIGKDVLEPDTIFLKEK